MGNAAVHRNLDPVCLKDAERERRERILLPDSSNSRTGRRPSSAHS
ncbi:MAG TPA: hypothetical protein VH370_10790 [Humisphaera sp.]|nr:hypothetical protein [Humisphaera sp.]